MKISRPVLINVSLGVVIVAAIAGSLLFLLPKSASGSTDGSTQLTSTVQQGVVSTSISASGQIAPVREVNANFEVSGTIATVAVALGDTVAVGQTLGTLDTTDLDSAVAKARTSLAQAKRDLSDANASLAQANTDAASSDPATASKGEQNQSSATSQVNSASDKVTSANDSLSSALANQAKATVTAPIAGLVIAVNGVVGDSAGSGVGGTTTAFVTIADVSAMTMTADIAEADIADVAVGQAADVTFSAVAGLTATATVTAIAPTATASNSVVTYATTITLDAIPEGLRLGQSAEVVITIESSGADALYVPSAAITTANDGTSTVDVVDADGAVTTTAVTLGLVGDQGTVILTGLDAGQTIVIGVISATSTGTSSTTGTGGFQGGGGFPSGGGNFPSGGFPGGGTAPEGFGGGR